MQVLVLCSTAWALPHAAPASEARLQARPGHDGLVGVVHTLAGGEVLQVSVTAQETEPQLVVVEQLSLDSVIDCDGRLYNTPTARLGIEAVVLAAGQACVVRAKQPQAAPGQVRVSQVPLGSAPLGLKAADWQRYVDWLALDLDNVPQRTAALKQLDQWLQDTQLAPLPRFWFGFARAQLRRRAGQHTEALQDYAVALRAAARLGRPDVLPTLHNSAGQSALALGDARTAHAHFQQAWEGAEHLKREGDAAVAHNNLCLVLQHEDRLEQASRCYAQAVAAFQAAGEVEQGTVARSNQAYVAQRAGDPHTALQALQEVLTLRQHGQDRRGLGLTHLKLAQLHLQIGRHEAALVHAEAAVNLAELRADPNDAAIARRQLAAVLAALQQPARALAYLEQAASEARQPETLTGILIDHAALLPRGAWSLALREQALELLEGRGVRPLEQLLRIEQARDWTALGRTAEARKALQDLRHQLPAGDISRVARWALASAEAAPDPLRAARHADAAARAYRELRDPEGELQALVLQARAELQQRRAPQALVSLQAVAQLHARLLAAAPGPALAASLMARQREWLPLVLQVADAWPEVGELPGETLWSIWNQAGIAPAFLPRERAGASTGEWQRYRLLAAQLREDQAGESSRRSAWLRELDQLERRLQISAGSAVHLSLAQWQARLQPGQVLLRFALGPERSWVWQVQRDHIERRVLPAAGEWLTRMQLARSSATRADALAATLWDGLPTQTRRVWVLPDARMHDWPFPALMLRRAAGPVPVAVASARQLPVAAADQVLPEAFRVQDVRLPAVQPLPGAARARRLLQARLGTRYRQSEFDGGILPAVEVWHLAAHGWHHPAFPGAAALGGDRPGSAGLTVGVSELSAVQAPRLVVLSSCEAAAADDWGSGQSLARSFADRFAAAVIAPTVPVDDGLAMQLDLALFEALQVEDPARALLSALQQMPVDRRQPLLPWQMLEAVGEMESP